MDFSERTYDDFAAEKLYENCDCISSSCGVFLFAYSQKNPLDEDLFQILISDDALKCEQINVNAKLMPPYLDGERYRVGNVYCQSDKDQYKTCRKCCLILPFDLEYYTNVPEIDCVHQCLCKICYDGEENFTVAKQETGIDNVRDWVQIFTYHETIVGCDCGYDRTYNDEYYCNLNRCSPHYGKFAHNYYCDDLGEKFDIIEHKTIADIVGGYKKKCKINL